MDKIIYLLTLPIRLVVVCFCALVLVIGIAILSVLNHEV